MASLFTILALLFVLNSFLLIEGDRKVCELCICDNEVLNCDQAGIKTLFTNAEWTSSLNSTPTDPDILKLRDAQLSGNSITRVKKFPLLPFTKLDLSQNAIILIEKGAFEKISNLTELDLSHNELTNKELTPDIFKGEYVSGDEYLPLKFLKKLDLGTNSLSSLDNDIFEHLPQLEELSLSGNAIKTIDNSVRIAINTPIALKILDISYLGLFELPERMFPNSLEIIRMAGNEFVQTPQAITRVANLRILDIDENPFVYFNSTNGIQNLTQLKELYISNMLHLKRIDAGAFTGLTNLTKFNCSHNPLMTSIDPKTFSWIENDEIVYPPIKELLLHDDGITSLSSQLIGRWDHLDRLDVGRNPWMCDCSNQWLVSNLIPLVNKTNPTLAKENMCYTPEEMHGWSLSALHSRNYQMRCLDMNESHPENDGAMLVGLLIGALIGIPLTLGSMLLWLRWRRHLGYHQASTESYTRFYKPSEEF